MKKVSTVESEVKALGIGVVAILAVIMSVLSGCAVPALLGVKSYQSGDTKIDFITGVDFGFGMNGIDTVKNNRGINPEQEDGAKMKPSSQRY
jgi:hypothetical protein